MNITEYAALDATELAGLVRKREISAEELQEIAIAAIESVEPALNAVAHPMFEHARATAAAGLPEGGLQGVPFVAKDLDGAMAGQPYRMGSRALRNHVATHDAEVILRLKRAGLNCVAKTTCPELGLLATNEPALYGATRNPWNPEHTPGGSSGGSAALVAARAVPIGHGGDGGGSLRIPASCCGLVGLKATRGRIPLGPNRGEGWGGYVQPGVLTRSVRDTAAVLDALAGPDSGAPYWAERPTRPFAQEIEREPGRLRIAFTSRSLFGRHTDPACVAAVESAAVLCESLGHEVSEDHPAFDRDTLVKAYLVQVAAATAVQIDEMGRWRGSPVRAGDVEPATWFLGQAGRSYSAADLQQARDTAHAAHRRLAPFFDRYDLLLTPTLAYPPVRIGELAPRSGELLGLRVLRTFGLAPLIRKVLAILADDLLERTPNTMLFNQTGQPAISLPLHWSDAGLPIGVQFVARYGEEATLLRIAAQLERARPWSDQAPAVRAG